MEKPNVVLKKVKTFQGRDGYGLNAEVWINGVYCTIVLNQLAIVILLQMREIWLMTS